MLLHCNLQGLILAELSVDQRRIRCYENTRKPAWTRRRPTISAWPRGQGPAQINDFHGLPGLASGVGTARRCSEKVEMPLLKFSCCIGLDGRHGIVGQDFAPTRNLN